MSLTWALLVVAGLAVLPAGGLPPIERAGGMPVQTDREVEVPPQPPRGALETGLSGDLLQLYTRAVSSTRAERPRESLGLLRQARTLSFRAYQAARGDRTRSYRHFVRVLYQEEQTAELIEIERHLERIRDRAPTEERTLLLHERALILHNQVLAVRGFTGQTDERLLSRALGTYESLIGQQSPLKTVIQIGYASLLAERGDLRAAAAALSSVKQEEQQTERFDLPMAYYYLASGDKARAVARLLQAARRDSWDHPSATHDGRTLRSMVYRMNDFDRLRDHPMFIEMVAQPEEEMRPF